MAVASLPPLLRTKLDSLGRRLNRLRVMHGSSWVALTLVIGAAIAFALDAWLELPPSVRFFITGGWLVAIAVVAGRQLIRPLRRRITAPSLAAAVEEEYPLGERLTSAVELADADNYHGSPAFIRLLVRDADQKSRALDFGRAARSHSTEWLAAATVAAVLLVLAPALFMPEYYFGLARRLVMPWDRRPAVIPFAIETKPGDAYAAKGRPLTITAELRPTREGVTLPDVCTLVTTGEDGRPLRLRMPAGQSPHTFAFRIDELKDGFRYRLEAGALDTQTYTVLALDPVELAGGPSATLTPPTYAKSLAVRTVDGPNDLSILEHGRIRLDCKLDRPAEAATLLITPTSGANPATERREVKLELDHRSGRVEMPAIANARLRLELDAGHGITTLSPEQSLTVIPDRPPEFRRVAGLPEHGAIRPNDALALDLTIEDDLAVAQVGIEYRINDGPVQLAPLDVPGIGAPNASGRVEFKLAGKVKDGDKLSVRLRTADNRVVPEANLGPNVVTFPPADRWIELRAAGDAESARQQEVAARRDDIEKRLRDLIGRVDRTVRKTYALHQNIEHGFPSAADQAPSIRELTDDQGDLAKTLTALAKDADLVGLSPLAEKMRAVDEAEFRQAGDAFRDAGQLLDKGRIAALGRAETAMTQARAKLESLLKENRDLADARLDEVRLDELAERERELAEQAKQVATPEELDKLAKEQQELADELKKLTENNDALKEAMQAAGAEEARRLAEHARQLAEAERKLDAQLADAERQRNAAKLADLARKQQELAADADRLSKRTQSAAQTAKSRPLDARPAAKAADDLRKGEADAAQLKQDQSAREIERAAEELQRGIDTAKDPREAAKQLSRLQDDNRKRLDRPAEKMLARQQQEAIADAVDNIKVPDENTAGKRDRQQAKELAAEAARALNRNDPENAEFRMGQAKDALDRLADNLPTAENRMRRARDEVARLRATQEEIARQAEKGDRTEAARKQADVADRLSKMDTPGQDARRERATQAAARAEDDLQNPKSPDVATSQADAKRALERLAEALAGQTPADEKAKQLARQERELAAGSQTDPAEVQRRQEQIARATQGLKATEAPVRHGEATRATIRANSAAREKPGQPETRQKMRDAAEKLDALADQLAGRETEAERADRLAKKQEAAARQPADNPGDAKRQANQIASEAQQVRAGEQAAAAKQQAAEALARLQRTNPDTPEHAEAQQQAADALRRMADQMKQRPAEAAAEPADLARQQHGLAREAEAASHKPADAAALRRLAERQQQLRQQANRLPTEQAPKEVGQARQAMQQAEQALARKDAGQAAQQQRQAADHLDNAARQMAQAKSTSQPNSPQPDGVPTPPQVNQARELARRQRDLQEQVRKATSADSATPAERAAANRQQEDLAGQTGDLAQGLEQNAGNMSEQQARQSARDAAGSARQGQDVLQDAQSDNAAQAKQARREAADALERAAQQAEQSAKGGEPNQPGNGSPQAGQQMQKAQGQMKQAGQQLGKGQPQQAGNSMQQAADALRQAARQMGQRGEPKGPREGDRPAEIATQGKGTPTAEQMAKDIQKATGKKWGELPGELRTRLVQEMKAQYGDDYARVIKLYFEQIADNNEKKQP